MNDMMLQATLLTRANRLSEATALIQRMLRGETDLSMTIGPADDIAPTRSEPSIVNSNSDSNDESDYTRLGAATFAHSPSFRALQDWPYRVRRHSASGLQGWTQRTQVSTGDIVPEGGKFIEAVYTNAAGSRAYKLYIPSRYQSQALPLIVMLHGGTQTPDDFAAGTRMNLIAEEQTCLVVYPTQPRYANPAKCWNWFRANDQRRGRGRTSARSRASPVQVTHDDSVDPQRVNVGWIVSRSRLRPPRRGTEPGI